MNFPSEEILEYIEELAPGEPEILKKLDRETNLKVPYLPQMCDVSLLLMLPGEILRSWAGWSISLTLRA